MAELIPGGSKVRVTNDTKLRYLDALAQHRLASSIRNEVDHFLRGLNELIPDTLLGIFDENELEVRLTFDLGAGGRSPFKSITRFESFVPLSPYSYCYAELANTAWRICALIT